MRKERSRRPFLESLEGKALLSASPMLPTPSAMIASASAAHVVTLSGTMTGTATQTQNNPDAGSVYQLRASGHVSPFGMTRASGSLHTPGFIASGNTTGTITLGSHKQGTLTLQVTGPTQPGFSPLESGTYTYKIVSGTGKYQGATGSGTIDLVVGEQTSNGMHSTHRVTLTFHGSGV